LSKRQESVGALRGDQKTLKIARVALTEVSIAVVEERVRLLRVFRELFQMRSEISQLRVRVKIVKALGR
jgi:hypothetical protein